MAAGMARHGCPHGMASTVDISGRVARTAWLALWIQPASHGQQHRHASGLRRAARPCHRLRRRQYDARQRAWRVRARPSRHHGRPLRDRQRRRGQPHVGVDGNRARLSQPPRLAARGRGAWRGARLNWQRHRRICVRGRRCTGRGVSDGRCGGLSLRAAGDVQREGQRSWSRASLKGSALLLMSLCPLAHPRGIPHELGVVDRNTPAAGKVASLLGRLHSAARPLSIVGNEHHRRLRGHRHRLEIGLHPATRLREVLQVTNVLGRRSPVPCSVPLTPVEKSHSSSVPAPATGRPPPASRPTSRMHHPPAIRAPPSLRCG